MNDSRKAAALWTLAVRDWADTPSPAVVTGAATALERGDVLFLPRLYFSVTSDEACLFAPDIGTAKNVSFDPESRRVHGASVSGAEAPRLLELLERFSHHAATLVAGLFPAYRASIQRARASFRPAEIAGRVTSWRKDDTRLHVDSFPATPVHGMRILRVFTNVNPAGRVRTWRVGGEFEAVAARFAGRLRVPLPGAAAVMQLLRITRTRRSAYDALMLQLHDRMKADAAFQADTPQTTVDFPAGSTWLAFTDQVSHAAMAGQYQLEQTFLLPVGAMREPERSPLRILERLKGRRLS